MAHKLRLEEADIEKALTEMKNKLINNKLESGKFDFSFKLDPITAKTKILFTQSVFVKMFELVRQTSTEIGWHGTVERIEGGFLITDIFCYPQVVSAAKVVTDDLKYAEWMQSLPNDKFNKLRFHGHSHVNMGVTPSVTDDKYREGLLSQLTNDMFYIFLIVNKKSDFNFIVYDMANNQCLVNADCSFGVIDDEDHIDDFVSESAKMVESPVSAVVQTSANTSKTTCSDKDTQPPRWGSGASKTIASGKEPEKPPYQDYSDESFWDRYRNFY